jgi:hypothetical protein
MTFRQLAQLSLAVGNYDVSRNQACVSMEPKLFGGSVLMPILRSDKYE